MRELEDVVLALHRACTAAGVPYVLVGGVAVMAWGQPRATMDVAVLATWQAAQVDAFVQALAREGLRSSAADLRDALHDGSHVTLFDTDSTFHVDVKPAASRAEREEVARGVALDFHGGRPSFAPAEETVAFKLSFGTPQDLQDARSIVVRQGEALDLARVRQVARRLGAEDALDDLLAQTARG